ncbi:uncharacterized protein LOC135818131 isoform X3 [Sycon ciliatum]|uniref:uncharacterized protein LOC135818131 isoform X3 n=1 Tax=Sycon ciliatum TaxID=27933 RepID=UPI0031F6499B
MERNLLSSSALAGILLLLCRYCGLAAGSFSLGIGSFNVKNFDSAKYDMYSDIYSGIVGWQKIFLLQEVLNTSIPDALVNSLNARSQYASNKPFRSITSELLGPDSGTRQAYAFIYRVDFVKVQQVYQYPIQNYTVFRRPPFSVKFQSPVVGSFICTGMHTSRPAIRELQALDGAVQHIQHVMGSHDILIMGDLNVGCGSVRPAEWSTISIATSSQYRWYVSSTVDTSLSGGCSDDRFIASAALSLRIPESSVEVYHYQDFYKLTLEEAVKISTHYPIQLEIIQPEPSESRPVQSTISEAALLKLYGYGAALGCGYITTTLQGALTDGSGLDENYRNDLDCVWVILAPLNHSISLRVTYTFENFYEDRLDIRDGYTLTSRLIARLQNKGNRTVTTTGNSLLLNFRTDSTGTGPGFVATFTTSPQCDYTLTDREGNFSSPLNSYTGHYPNNLHCTWNIRVPLGMVIKLSFSNFQVEPDGQCAADYVIVVDGLVTKDIFSLAPAKVSALQLSQNTLPNTRLCGTILPQPFTSAANQIGLGFSSDYTNTNKGFTVFYKAVDASSCQNGFHFSGHHGNFEDNSGPSITYAPNQNCSYFIEVPAGHIISVKFLVLDVEPSPGCQFDYLSVWDTASGHILERLCGFQPPENIIVSSGSRMRVQFVTDGSLEFSGFVLSYRACPRCADGMFAALPCFDVYSGFCTECRTCSADEIELSPCTATTNRVCAEKGTPPLEEKPAQCRSDHFLCRGGGVCMPKTILCDGVAQCPQGDDESHCACNVTSEFRCNNGKCIPLFLRCEGQDTCLDGSDELDCVCDKQNEFMCGDDKSSTTKCIPLGWRCDGVVDCQYGVDEQGCMDYSSVDACSIDRLPVFSKLSQYRLATLAWVRHCLASIPLRPSIKNTTLRIIRDGVLGLYAYTDLIHNSLESDSRLAPGLNYTVHNISIDIEKELSRIEATDYRAAYDFHRDVTVLMSHFDDAHTLYLNPFAAISFLLPFVFGSALVDGKQRVTIDRVQMSTFPAYYELHKGPPFINFDKFSSIFPNLDGLQPENLVNSINGMPALDFLRQMADPLGNYKSAGARFNDLLSTTTFTLGSYPLPSNDTLDIVFDDNTALHLKYTAFISVPAGLTLRSFLTTQYSVKELVKLAQQQRLFEQFIRQYKDNSNVPLALTQDQQRLRRKRLVTYEPAPKVLTTIASYDSKMFLFYFKNAVIVKMTAFQFTKLEPVKFLQFFNQTRALARQKGTQTLLLDLTGNGGGFVQLAQLLMAYLRPEWISSPHGTICQPLDVRIGDFLSRLSTALTHSRSTLAGKSMTLQEAQTYWSLLNTTASGQTVTPVVLTPEVMENFSSSIQEPEISDAQRGAVVSEFLERVVFTPIETLVLGLMQKPANIETGEAFTLEQVVNGAVERQRGGRTSRYSQKYVSKICLDVLQDLSVKGLFPTSPPFERVAILSDGRCGSACSQFSSQMLLSRAASVITYGGYAGEPLDSSAFAGGNVLIWSDVIWKSGLSMAIWSMLVGSDPELTFNTYGFTVPLPLPSSALTRFDFTEVYIRELGPDSLPREWYTLPGTMRLPRWTSGTSKYPLDSAQQVALLGLYQDALTEFRRGTSFEEQFEPCLYKVRCRPHSSGLWSTSSVTFTNTTLWRNDHSVYNNSECSEAGLEMTSVRYAKWSDMGLNTLSPKVLSASDVRKLSIAPTEYTITLYTQKWVDTFIGACPCQAWRAGQTLSIVPGTCAAGTCRVSLITFNTLYGNYVLQDPTHIYVSPESESESAAESEPIDGNAIFTLHTVYERCFPVTPPVTLPPPTTMLIEEGSVRVGRKLIKGWKQYDIYIGNRWVTICGDGWARADAQVYCGQQFAYYFSSTSRTSSSVALNSSLPQLTESIRFNCSGEELRLLQCPHFVVKTCTDDLLRVHCTAEGPNSDASADHRALDYGLGISAGVAGLSIILIICFLIRKARIRATQFSNNDIANMQLGQPKSWWRWTPLNEVADDTQDFAYSASSIDYTAT